MAAKSRESRGSTKEDVKQHLQDAWNALDRGVLDNLVASMPTRLAKVIKNKGGHTEDQSRFA